MQLARFVGLSTILKNLWAFKHSPQGYLEWAMQWSRRVFFILWKDKEPVLLLSAHAVSIPLGHELSTMPRINEKMQESIPTS